MLPFRRFLLLALPACCIFFDSRGDADPTAIAPTPVERRPVIWNNADTFTHRTLTHHTLASAALSQTVGFTVYLPPGYVNDSAAHYPVAYFLHGAGGNENSDGPGFAAIVDRLISAGKVPPVICVFPNGGMTAYRDHPDTGLNVETMIIGELLPLIDQTYRTLAQRESRVIAGYSMGGGGAVRLALLHSDLFSTAASWAGAVVDYRTHELPPELTGDDLRAQEPTVRVLMITGYEDKVTHAGHWPFIELLREAHYPFTLRTLRDVPHNLGLYYQLTGDDLVTFLLQTVSTQPIPAIATATIPGAGETDSPTPAAVTDRVGFPHDYATTFEVLRTVPRANDTKLVTVYGNAFAAGVETLPQLPYPYGAIFVMETAATVLDADGKPVRDAVGALQKQTVLGLHVMRREPDFGAGYGESRSGEWEYVEYGADGTFITPPEQTATCAACHIKAGPAKDFVFHGRFPD